MDYRIVKIQMNGFTTSLLEGRNIKRQIMEQNSIFQSLAYTIKEKYTDHFFELQFEILLEEDRMTELRQIGCEITEQFPGNHISVSILTKDLQTSREIKAAKAQLLMKEQGGDANEIFASRW